MIWKWMENTKKKKEEKEAKNKAAAAQVAATFAKPLARHRAPASSERVSTRADDWNTGSSLVDLQASALLFNSVSDDEVRRSSCDPTPTSSYSSYDTSTSCDSSSSSSYDSSSSCDSSSSSGGGCD